MTGNEAPSLQRCCNPRQGGPNPQSTWSDIPVHPNPSCSISIPFGNPLGHTPGIAHSSLLQVESLRWRVSALQRRGSMGSSQCGPVRDQKDPPAVPPGATVLDHQTLINTPTYGPTSYQTLPGSSRSCLGYTFFCLLESVRTSFTLGFILGFWWVRTLERSRNLERKTNLQTYQDPQGVVNGHPESQLRGYK